MNILPSHKKSQVKNLDSCAGARLENFNLELLTTLPKKAHISLLPAIARSFDVDISNLSEEEARKLIENAIEAHKYAGTPYALKKALNTFFECEVVEWHESGGEAYTFHIALKYAGGLDVFFFKYLDHLVMRFKNVRSLFGGVKIEAQAHSNITLKSALICGETIKLFLPQIPLLSPTKEIKIGACIWILEEIKLRSR